MDSSPLDDALIRLHCPGCAYDLRGSDAGDCPECGHVIDRIALRELASRHPAMLGRAMFLATFAPFVVGVVSLLMPKVDWLVPLWYAYIMMMGTMVLITAIIDSRHYGLRRVVVNGRQPSRLFVVIVFLCEVAMLAFYAFFMFIVALGLSLTRWSSL